MKNAFCARLLPVGISLTLLTGVLTGCGGGSTVQRPAAVTLKGTLQDSSGAPLVGYKVVYTPGGVQPQKRLTAQGVTVLSTTTDSQGSYTLVIPYVQITGHDALAFYDTTGAFTQTQSLTLSSTQGGTITVPQNVVTTVPLPPAPPAAPSV